MLDTQETWKQHKRALAVLVSSVNYFLWSRRELAYNIWPKIKNQEDLLNVENNCLS